MRGDVLFEPWLSEAECVVNLSLSTPAPEPVAPGEVMTYTHQIANHGPGHRTGVVFTAQLPEDVTVTFVSATFPESHARHARNACRAEWLCRKGIQVHVQVWFGEGAREKYRQTATRLQPTPH